MEIREMEWHGYNVGKCAVGCLSFLAEWEEGLYVFWVLAAQ